MGKCSLTAAIPVISAMGVQACPLPTAVLSNQTGYGSYFWDDYTDRMQLIMDEWKKIGFKPDGVYTGFLADARQVDVILKFTDMFCTDETHILIDPVMGDGGNIYRTYSEELCEKMRILVQHATVITPNLTEACRILDLDYHKVDLSEEGLAAICEALSDMGPSRIVITGLQQGDLIFNYIFEKNKTSELLSTRKIGGDRSGTGDVFSSIVTGALIQGQDFKTAVRRAVTFLDKAIAYTAQMELPWNYGICFEEYLEEI